ncbi:uracil-DNA glycosylase [Candidatus Bathyarchaeota archaeon]|nr:uracil-DNA glycosylase [Candidatus Bathyarchaeota archaeon]
MNINLCVWYNDSSGVKRAYDLGLIDRKWVELYCWNCGRDCVRKKRFEEEGYVSPDYVLPDGSVSQPVKEYMKNKKRL